LRQSGKISIGKAQGATAYVEGFNAAFADKISVQSLLQDAEASNVIDGERAFRFLAGYDQLPELMLSGGVNLRLDSPVKEVRWREGEVSAFTGHGRFVAEKLIVTVPLPLLQLNTIGINPEPVEVLRAARRLAMGQVMRVTVCFRERFWEEKADFSFLHSLDQAVPTWWSTLPVYAPVLVGWAAGPHFRPNLNLRDAVRSLAAILGMLDEKVERQIVTTYFHDWCADPFARGAYSYTPAGSIGVHAEIAKPVENTLFFAGEHTETGGHSGTVHGAILTGQRAARQVLA